MYLASKIYPKTSVSIGLSFYFFFFPLSPLSLAQVFNGLSQSYVSKLWPFGPLYVNLIRAWGVRLSGYSKYKHEYPELRVVNQFQPSIITPPSPHLDSQTRHYLVRMIDAYFFISKAFGVNTKIQGESFELSAYTTCVTVSSVPFLEFQLVAETSPEFIHSCSFTRCPYNNPRQKPTAHRDSRVLLTKFAVTDLSQTSSTHFDSRYLLDTSSRSQVQHAHTQLTLLSCLKTSKINLLRMSNYRIRFIGAINIPAQIGKRAYVLGKINNSTGIIFNKETRWFFGEFLVVIWF